MRRVKTSRTALDLRGKGGETDDERGQRRGPVVGMETEERGRVANPGDGVVIGQRQVSSALGEEVMEDWRSLTRNRVSNRDTTSMESDFVHRVGESEERCTEQDEVDLRSRSGSLCQSDIQGKPAEVPKDEKSYSFSIAIAMEHSLGRRRELGSRCNRPSERVKRRWTTQRLEKRTRERQWARRREGDHAKLI